MITIKKENLDFTVFFRYFYDYKCVTFCIHSQLNIISLVFLL
jgi:hypothetical protein